MLKLLCIDDCPEVLELMTIALEADGFQVMTCTSPREGLAKLFAQNFDAVVTDLNMPDMNGLSFANHARANGYTKPIILCTGNPPAGRWRPEGIDAVVLKGSGPSVLSSTLHECISKQANVTPLS